ncbi:MAG: dihydrofolate reductase, partial [Bacteroidota bacterium]
MKISLIVAQSQNRVIGRDNDLPWRLPTDLKRFKRLTLNHFILMGRKTFDSIGKPLPKRTSVVISRNPDLKIEGAVVENSLEAALQRAREAGEEEVFIIGGAEIFKLALPLADTLYLTQVEAEVEGDVLFPELNPANWEETLRETHPK